MSEWKEIKIDQLCEAIIDCVNKTAPIVDEITPYRMVRTTNVKDGRVDLSSTNYVTGDVFRQWTRRSTLTKGDIILTREAPLGEVGKIIDGENLFLGQRLMMYRPDSNIVDPDFLFYAFLSKEVQHQIKSFGMGSTVEHMRVGDCSEIIIKVPSLWEQQEIGKTLDILDRKISNLRQQNKTLESIAQTLFKHWFVDFEFPNEDGKPYKSSGGAMVRSDLRDIPVSWRVGKLGEIALFKNGKTPPDKAENCKIPIYGSNGIIGNTDIFNNKKTIIIGRVGSYFGSLYYYLGKCWITDNAMTGSLRNHDSHAYLYFFLASRRLNKLSGGSGQPLLNQSILSSLELAIVDEKFIQDFEKIADPLFRKISNNQDNIQTLTKTRDRVLPKLMSGQLRIPE